jgi:hypothetical protein
MYHMNFMSFLTQQPSWGRCRDFEIASLSVVGRGITAVTMEDMDDDKPLFHGRPMPKVAFMPSQGMAYRCSGSCIMCFLGKACTIYYCGYYLLVSSVEDQHAIYLLSMY